MSGLIRRQLILFVVLCSAWSTVLFAESRDIISQGIGFTIGEAAQNAAENALMQASGAMLSSQEIIDRLPVVETVVSAQAGEISPNPEDYPQGSIEEFEILGNVPFQNFTRVTARVRVNLSTLQTALRSSPGSGPPVAPVPPVVEPTTPINPQALPEGGEPSDEPAGGFFTTLTQSILDPIVSAEALEVSVGQTYESADDSIRQFFGKLADEEHIVEFLVRVSITSEHLDRTRRFLREWSSEERTIEDPEQRMQLAIGTVFGEQRVKRNEYVSWDKVASHLASTPAETFYFSEEKDAHCDGLNDYVSTAGIYRGWKDENLNQVQVEFVDQEGQILLSKQLGKAYDYRATPPVAVRGAATDKKHPLRSAWGMLALLSSPGPDGSFLPDRSGNADNTQVIFSSNTEQGGCPGILVTPTTEFIIAAKVSSDVLQRTTDVRVTFPR